VLITIEEGSIGGFGAHGPRSPRLSSRSPSRPSPRGSTAYGGESFQITGESPANGGDDIVDTKMLRPNDDPVDLNYRLRKSGDDWKIIDVYLSGTISQLANYRSEFSTTLRTKGADGWFS
jgi:hypothetical protein